MDGCLWVSLPMDHANTLKKLLFTYLRKGKSINPRRAEGGDYLDPHLTWLLGHINIMARDKRLRYNSQLRGT